jgi:SAM-dependent methyltransferase
MRDVARASLPPREAYPLWAPAYDTENALTALDERAAGWLALPHPGRLLDAACGTGRRLPTRGRESGAAAGIDLVFEMLAAGRPGPVRGRVAAADLHDLPFPSRTFDRVWCRLALGHVEALGAAYRELSRVSRSGAHLLVTDIHPEAVARGLKRTFLGCDGVRREVIHHAHEPDDHTRAATDAGLGFDARLDLAVGEAEQPWFRKVPGLFESERGRPLLLALRFVKGV